MSLSRSDEPEQALPASGCTVAVPRRRDCTILRGLRHRARLARVGAGGAGVGDTIGSIPDGNRPESRRRRRSARGSATARGWSLAWQSVVTSSGRWRTSASRAMSWTRRRRSCGRTQCGRRAACRRCSPSATSPSCRARGPPPSPPASCSPGRCSAPTPAAEAAGVSLVSTTGARVAVEVGAVPLIDGGSGGRCLRAA